MSKAGTLNTMYVLNDGWRGAESSHLTHEKTEDSNQLFE